MKNPKCVMSDESVRVRVAGGTKAGTRPAGRLAAAWRAARLRARRRAGDSVARRRIRAGAWVGVSTDIYSIEIHVSILNSIIEFNKLPHILERHFPIYR